MSEEKPEKWVRVSDNRWRLISRRELLKLAAAGAAAASAWPFINVPSVWAQQRRLTILHWSHFVPGYDVWFDRTYAREWGRANDVEVTVDHIPFGQIPARAAAEVAARSGHDLYQHISPAATLEPETEDMGDIIEPLIKKYGMQELARRSTYNPKTKKWFALSNSWVPDPGHYRKDLFDLAGYVPDSWDNVLLAGRKLKPIGHPIGIGLSPDIDANYVLRDVIWSYGGTTQNQAGEVVINSKNTVEAVKYVTALFKEAMTPEVLAWDASSNNLAMLAGKVSFVFNAISIARTSEKDNNQLTPFIQIWKPPRGPKMLGGKRLGAQHVILAYMIWKFTPPERKKLAKQFLVDFINQWGPAFENAELYEFPSFPGTVPNLKARVTNDPAAAKFGQPDKYKELATATQWSTNVGHPGFANAAEGELFDTFIIPQMFALAATDRMSPEDAVKWAEAQMKPVWAKWKQRGLM